MMHPQYPDRSKMVYLICHKEDSAVVFELFTYLEEQAFKVILPRFKGSPKDIRRAEVNALKTCDVAVLYYGAGDESWFVNKEKMLAKVAGYYRKGSYFSRCLFLAKPLPEKSLRHVGGEEIRIVRGSDTAPYEALVQVIQSEKPS